MWAYFLIIIAPDKVINFKTTLFFSRSKRHSVEIKSEAQPGTQAIAWPVAALPRHQRAASQTRSLLMGSGRHPEESGALER